MRQGGETTLPPGPRIPRAGQTALLWFRTIPFLEECRRRYGPIFWVWASPIGRLVYVADPAAIKDLFAADPAVLRPGQANQFLRPVVGSNSILLLDEDAHMRQRKLMLPPFHGEAVRGYGELIAEIAERDVEGWPAGRPFPVRPRMQAITLEVILRAVFGLAEGERLDRLRELMPRVSEIGGVTMLLALYPDLGRFGGPWRRYRELQAEVDRLLFAEIAERRAAGGGEGRDDVLSLLLQARDTQPASPAGTGEDGRPMTDAELRDELVTLLLAGHETTATGLAWAFERLVRHPAALERLRAEVDSGEGDEYADAVVKETLRVRPVITDVARALARPYEVMGHRLPAGASVMPAIALVQRDPAFYPQPLAFRPERFLEGSPPSFTWIPFGGGRRRCLGAALATLEMKTVLRVVLSRVDLAAADPRDEPTRTRHITMVPARGAEVVARRRARRRPGDSARVTTAA